MAWLLDPQVDIVFAGLLLALLCYGVVFLITAIGSVLPKINLVVVTVDLGKIFTSITGGVVSWLTGFAQSRVVAVENWFRAIAYDLTTLFNSTIGSLYAHASQIQHIWDQGIPNAARAAVATAHAYTADQVQGVRLQVHAAQTKWEQAHTHADALAYIAAERLHPSVENAQLAMHARTLIASEAHAQDLHNQLYDYIGRHITGQADVALPYTGQTLTGVAGAIAIPGPIDLGKVDVQDIIKTGANIAIGTAVAVIATKIVECLVSSCAGNNNFNSLLQDALGLASLAEFAVFLKAFVEDPAGTISQEGYQVQGLATTGVNDLDHVWTALEGALGL